MFSNRPYSIFNIIILIRLNYVYIYIFYINFIYMPEGPEVKKLSEYLNKFFNNNKILNIKNFN